MPVRRLPQTGDHIIIAFFGTSVHGVIEQVEEDRRRVHVLTEDGDAITFALSRATGQFVAEDGSSGARLVFTTDRERTELLEPLVKLIAVLDPDCVREPRRLLRPEP